MLIEMEAEKLVDMDKVQTLAKSAPNRAASSLSTKLTRSPVVKVVMARKSPAKVYNATSCRSLKAVRSTPSMVRSRHDHILFIAAGAFHVAKPSDLIPELQGRFPIRVELDSLEEADFVRILTEPNNALIRQYQALMETEGIHLKFSKEAIAEIAKTAARVNERTENIGARRLHTIMETLLEELSFNAPELQDKSLSIDDAFVRERLADIADNEDLSRYIL